MLLVNYRVRGSGAPWRAGIAHDQEVIDANEIASPAEDSPRGQTSSSVRRLLEQGSAHLEDVFTRASQLLAQRQHAFPLASVELGPPVPDPDKILCLGVNYRDHATEAGIDVPPVPLFFAKFRNSLTGPTSPIILPPVSTRIDYEGELTVIIGTRCKAVAEEEALQYVAGYTIMNDVSARDLQMQTSQWIAGKAL